MRKVRGMQAILKNRESLKAKGLDLLKVLQSEITHELSSPCFQHYQTDPPRDFTVEWDTPNSNDIVLRKKCDTGEEVAVSALVGPPIHPKDWPYPRDVQMKVCIKKPGLSSLLKFDCDVFGRRNRTVFHISSADIIRSVTSTDPRYIKRVFFRDLSPLEVALTEYLETKGIGESLLKFLLVHLHKKEENQYVSWLQKLQKMLSRDD